MTDRELIKECLNDLESFLEDEIKKFSQDSPSQDALLEEYSLSPGALYFLEIPHHICKVRLETKGKPHGKKGLYTGDPHELKRLLRDNHIIFSTEDVYILEGCFIGEHWLEIEYLLKPSLPHSLWRECAVDYSIVLHCREQARRINVFLFDKDSFLPPMKDGVLLTDQEMKLILLENKEQIDAKMRHLHAKTLEEIDRKEKPI